MSDPIIQLSGVSKNFVGNSSGISKLFSMFSDSHFIKNTKVHNVINNINLSIYDGEAVGIIGRNGAGKSTLLKLIAGIYKPSSGLIKATNNLAAIIELSAGINKELSGYENIFILGQLHGLSKDYLQERLEDIIEFSELRDYLEEKVSTYSSGMILRLSFSVITIINPKVFIIDEALLVGDVFFQAKCNKFLQEFKKNGNTLILVSHSARSVIELCGRAILLENGTISFDGKPSEAIDLYVKKSESNKSTLTAHTNDSKHEYGTKEISISSFGIYDSNGIEVSNINPFDIYTIKIKYKINNQVLNPIFGYFISDKYGKRIIGQNTLKAEKKIELSSVKFLEISFTQQLPLNSGEYFLNVGCSKIVDSNIVSLHRIYNKVTIYASHKFKAVGLIFPNDTINIHKS